MTNQLELEAASETTSPERLVELAYTDISLARIVARNATTTPKFLELLSASADERTRQGVASNPNTPTNILLLLGEEFPGELLDNPVFPLWMLENPNCLIDFPLETVLSLLKYNAVPEWFLEWAASSNDGVVICTLLMNQRTPKTALQRINNNFSLIQDEVKLHINWDSEIEGLDNLVQEVRRKIADTCDAESRYSGKEERRFLQEIGIFPETFFKSLPEEDINYKLASDYLTPSHVLEMLLGDVSLIVREAALLNVNTPFNIVCEYKYQENAIKNLSTSGVILYELAQSRWVSIRKGVALHPNTPIEVLKKLAQDEDVQVRGVVALNLNTPIFLLQELALSYPDCVACHPFCPSEVLESLYQQRYSLDIIAKHPNTPIYILEELANSEYKSLVAQNPKISIPLFNKLARDASDEVRSVVAQNPSIPEAILARLETDTSQRVGNAVANQRTRQQKRNYIPDIPDYFQGLVFELPSQITSQAKNIASQLGIEDVPMVTRFQNQVIPERQLLLFNWEELQGNNSQNLKEQIYTAINPNSPSAALELLAQHCEEAVRHAVAINPSATANSLAILANDNNPNIRKAVASHQNTPIDILIKLAKDTVLAVQKTLIFNFNTPMRIIYELVDDSSLVISIVARLRYLPATTEFFEDIITKIITQVSDENIIKLVLSTRHLPQKLIQLILNTKYKSCYSSILAGHPNTPLKTILSILPKLSHHPITHIVQNLRDNFVLKLEITSEELAEILNIEDSLAFFVVRHPNISANVLAKLTTHHHEIVRLSVAKNDNTPLDSLKLLLQDDVKEVRDEALYTCRKNTSSQNNLQPLFDALEKVTKPKASPSTLAKLAHSQWIIVRETIALHPKTFSGLLEKLADDDSKVVRCAVATNQKIHVSLLEKLANDNNDEVKMAVIHNPTTPSSLLEYIAQQNNNKNFRMGFINYNPIHSHAIKHLIKRYTPQVGKFLATYAKKGSSLMRLSVFLHPLAPSKLLIDNHCSTTWWERYVIAINPSTPLHILSALAQDGNRIIRQTAIERLKVVEGEL